MAQVTFDPMKPEVMQRLHAMIHERLFGRGPWLVPSSEFNDAVGEKLESLGLLEPGEIPDSHQLTALGREVHLQLMMVFMGYWCETDIPMLLWQNGLISEEEEAELETRVYKAMDKNEAVDPVLLPVVRRAFFDYFLAGAWAN
jgi:hypothetical protein